MATDESPIRPPSTDASIDERGAFVRGIYRIALEPQSHDVFAEHWNDHASRAFAALEQLRASADPEDEELQEHFQVASGILAELEAQRAEPLHEGNGVRMLVDATGSIAWSNAAATRLFNLSPQTDIAALEPFLNNLGPLRKLLGGLESRRRGGGSDRYILRFQSANGAGYLLTRAIDDRCGRSFVLIEPLLSDWTSGLGRLLADAFALTPAETQVAAGIAQGFTATAIASQQRVSVPTAMMQIQALMKKTGASSQSDLVRLLISIACACDRVSRETDEPVAPAICLTARGREVPIVLRGPQGGSPVIFFHGMLDGCGTTPRFEAALERAGLRLIAPVRPGFGPAAPRTGPPATAAARFAEDVEQVLDRMRLDRVVLLGHMAGALYAFATAARLKERVLGIVNVAGAVPILSTRQFAGMSRRQRLLAYIARFMPDVLPVVLRAGIRKLEFDGARSFMTAIYENSPRDLAAVLNTEIYQTLSRGYRFTVAQGYRALQTDGLQVVRDWSEVAVGSEAPVTLLHGRHDPVVSAASVEEFAHRLGERATVRMFDRCGQLLLYTAPEAVCRTLRAQLETGEHVIRPRPTTWIAR